MNSELSGGWGSVILLGFIEGISEFLPISSTGHLIVAAHLLGENSSGITVFEIVIQLGAISAICWHYRRRLYTMTRGTLGGDARETRLLLQLITAFLPAAILGLLLHSIIKSHLFFPFPVAIALICGGIIILLVERRRRPPHISDLAALSYRDALLIGCAQSFALIPGVSRAGATIIGGLLRGLNRPAAAEFSFLLALPTMFAAAGYDLYKNADVLSSALIAQIGGGFAVAFITALLTIRALLAFISRHTFTPFGWYRIIFGAMILFFPSLFGS